MKKTTAVRATREMRAEYTFDYAKARPNRFAGRVDKDRVVVVLDPDIAAVFTTAESVKAVLRALIATMPRSGPGQDSAPPTGAAATEQP